MQLTERTMPGYGDPATWAGASPEPEAGFAEWLESRLTTALADHEDELHEAAWECLPYECLRWCLVLAHSPSFCPLALQQFGREVATTPVADLPTILAEGGIDTLPAIDLAVNASAGIRATWPAHILSAADTLRAEVLKVAPSWLWLRDTYELEQQDAAMRARCRCRFLREGCQC